MRSGHGFTWAEKALAALVAGAVLAAFGGFVSLFLSKLRGLFTGEQWPTFLLIVSIVAVCWFIVGK